MAAGQQKERGLQGAMRAMLSTSGLMNAEARLLSRGEVDARQRQRQNKSAIKPVLFIAVLFTTMMLTGCAGGSPAKGTDSEAGGKDAEALREQLQQSAAAADKPANWTIEMKLGQKLDEGGQVFAMNLTTVGPVEREPLRMKQSIQSQYEEENSKMETILTPDAYYMHDLATDDWMRMTESAIPEAKETLSDYQIRPSEPIKRLAAAADKLHATKQADGSLSYDYDGDGTDAGAKAIIDDILRGTFGGKAMTEDITESIQVKAFVYRMAVDSATKLPKTVNMSMALSIEFEPGHRSILNQTLDIAYGKWGTTPAITVPDAAKSGEEIMPPTQELIDELERLQGEQAPAS